MVGIGRLSRLGKSAVVATDCITQAHGSVVILHGLITVPVTNSDKLIATYPGSFVPTGGTVFETKEVTCGITGGIGRFEGQGQRGNGRTGRLGDASGIVERQREEFVLRVGMQVKRVAVVGA